MTERAASLEEREMLRVILLAAARGDRDAADWLRTRPLSLTEIERRADWAH